MGDITSGYAWSAGETVTPAKLNQMLGSSSLAIGARQIISADISAQYADASSVASPSVDPSLADGLQIFSASIVPNSASNKVLIQFSISAWGAGVTSLGGPIGMAIFRDSTLVAKKIQKNCDTSTTEQQAYDFGFNFLDSPASTISVTYSARLYACAGGGTIPVGINMDASSNTYPCGPAILSELVGVS